MSFLIDTNVISELRRKSPEPRVVAWFTKCPADNLFLSVLTLGELRKGIEKLDESQRKLLLINWLEHDVPAYFGHRILSIDGAVADRWGRLLARAGRPLPAVDSLLAATALAHGLQLVTRNEKDFTGMDLEVINPWAAL